MSGKPFGAGSGRRKAEAARRRKADAASRTLPLFGLTPGDVLRVAALAGVDPRTVRAVVDGGGSKLSRGAVLEALRSLKLAAVAASVEAARG